MRIGIDFGNVVIGGGNEWFGREYLSSPPVPNAYQSILDLLATGHEIFGVSKAYPRNQVKTVKWLRTFGFDHIFQQSNTFFVLRREDKAIVANHMNLDFMIDDRKDIIDCINTETECLGMLFTSWTDTMSQLATHNVRV